jgi:hypothetical protein
MDKKVVFGRGHFSSVGPDNDDEANEDGVDKGVGNVQGQNQAHGQGILIQLIAQTQIVADSFGSGDYF